MNFKLLSLLVVTMVFQNLNIFGFLFWFLNFWGDAYVNVTLATQILQCKPIVFHVWMLSLKVCITQGSISSKDRRCRFNLGFSVNKGRSSIFSNAHSGTHLSHVNPAIHALGASIYNMEAANFAWPRTQCYTYFSSCIVIQSLVAPEILPREGRWCEGL